MSKSKNSFASLNKKDKVDFYISLVVILLAGILVLAFTFPSINNMEKHNKNALLTENTMNISSIIINNNTYKPLEKPFKSRVLIETPTEIGSLDAKQITSTSKELSIVKVASEGITIDKKEEASEVLNYIENVENDENDSDRQDVEDEILDSITTELKNAKNIAIEDKIEVVVEEINESPNETDTSKSCVIIIGAFKKEANKEKLLDGLKSDGYMIFTAPYKGSTRIGIYQPCNSETISATLKSVRGKYAKDAMILVAE